ncbi:MAG: metal-dependent hydrolase [Rhodoferax sp.]|uniref:metal-dependent hydrolase n=1 Tax=Rhodoferax sp. TaxID=50421 RepID=UPI00271D7ECE|nr:metal-dependent hydrolase [Rhodoferax sp.]MDO8447551.1 metal-dependent hydrolase [Rhodoferax sp.]
MTDLVVRRLLIDLDSPVARHWFGGDAFRTALFNALSMSFPVGEQFFIDSVRTGLKTLSAADQEKYRIEAQGFIGQEATHRRIHGLFNVQIEKHGLVNDWEPRARERLKLLNGFHPRHWLAITAATEHFTAVFADWILSNPDLFDGTETRLKTMWLWHSAEEAEHKSTAFDLYRALGGTDESRIKWFKRITFIFLSDLLRQTVNNLYRDGTLWKWRTWKSAASFLFGQRGMIRLTYKPWRAYKQPDFHPNQLASELSRDWLQSHTEAYSIVGTQTPVAA